LLLKLVSLDLSTNAYSSSLRFDSQDLRLNYNKLIGPIDQIQTPNSVHYIDLSFKNIHGPIPSYLLLNDNQLEGLLPRSLANCSFLVLLNVRNNKLNDTFPYWLASLPMLQVLLLRNNSLHGPMSNSIVSSNFSTLRVLDLSHNELTCPLPTKFFQNLRAMKDGTEERFWNIYGIHCILNWKTMVVCQDVTIGDDAVISAFRLSEDRNRSLVGAILSKVVPATFSTIASFSKMIWRSEQTPKRKSEEKPQSLSEDRNRSLVGAILSKVVPATFSTIASFSKMIWRSEQTPKRKSEEKPQSFSFDMFEGSPKKRGKAHLITQWHFGCYYRFTWSYIALRYSGTCSSATMEGFFCIYGYRDASCFFMEMLVNKEAIGSGSSYYEPGKSCRLLQPTYRFGSSLDSPYVPLEVFLLNGD
ncbi:Rab3-GAP regulatory subunit, partial [Theobroma cacao]